MSPPNFEMLTLAQFPQGNGPGGWICLAFAVFAGLAIAIRIVAGAFDQSRIAEYIQSRGGRVVSVQWSPFGRGWFGEKNDRIYEVVYYDADGLQHFATCKTSLFSGVYWTEDRVSHAKPQWFDKANATSQEPFIQGIEFLDDGDLRDENRRLKEEVARLKSELEGRDRI
ncbi:MAG TPA: hypothetical protein VFV87_18435 [Pirellulaceae bacterium]|nr:hypothetical protein [Pirellulaceae bacterium]